MTGKWAMRDAVLVVWPQVGTDDTIRVICAYKPSTALTLESDDTVFSEDSLDDGLNHMRESLLIWRVASRLVTRNRELSQSLEYRARQAEHELNIEFEEMNSSERVLTRIVKVADA